MTSGKVNSPKSFDEALGMVLGSMEPSPPREDDTRGYGGLGINQTVLDLCHAWRDSSTPIARAMASLLRASADEPFRGLTTDGTVVSSLFEVQDTGISTKRLKEAADSLLETLRPEHRVAISFPLNADEWRLWMNANEWANRHGAFLGAMNQAERSAFESLLAASLSDYGYGLVRDAMKLNEHLGEICEDLEILNQWVYWISIFGTPSLEEPWGWQLDGHHINLNVFVLGTQIVVTPMFVGAEPRTCEAGQFAGTKALTDLDEPGTALMEVLADRQREEAILYPSILSTDLPPELAGRGNGRHRGGAMSDNLVIPYEGVSAGTFDNAQKRLLLDLCEMWVKRLPPGHDGLKMDEINHHLDQTYFSWIGGYGRDEPSYYKVHSPVTWLEYDNHAAIFLGNPEPEKYHTHTIMRTPNGNDYGKDLLRLHYQRDHISPTRHREEPS